MIHLINETTNAYLVLVDALPEPSDRAYAMAANRASKLHHIHDNAWDGHFKAWENGKRRPTARDCAELAWVAANAKDATVAHDGISNGQAMFVIAFPPKAKSLMFKLTFGGQQCEPLAFAA